MKQKILIILGPTASGKSALGVELARRFNGEVVSADSRQVYKGLNIGTGKVTKREMRGIRHHMLDVASPKRVFSAGDYVRTARKSVVDIARRGNLPILVGGTGFYIDALVGRIGLAEVSPNEELRKWLSKRSPAQLYAQLKKLDPKRAKMMDTPSERNNKVRLIRAIEIARSKPRPRGEIVTPHFDLLWIGVRPTDTDLKRRIDSRLTQRIRAGMVGEARRLHRSGLSYRRMKELGLEYRSLARHLQGEITLTEMELELEGDIWRYARKQIGYWKRNNAIQWFKPGSKKIAPVINRWLRQ